MSNECLLGKNTEYHFYPHNIDLNDNIDLNIFFLFKMNTLFKDFWTTFFLSISKYFEVPSTRAEDLRQMFKVHSVDIFIKNK